MTRRTDRVNGLLRLEISQLVSRELRDPRLSGVVSITQVDTSGDLRHARVFISVLGTKEKKEQALKGIHSASGFIRRELKGRLSLKYVPELSFQLDQSMEDAEHMLDVIDRIPLDDATLSSANNDPGIAGN